MVQPKQLAYIVGVLSILVCLATWSMDLTGLVEQCIYCRTERSIIGLIGFIMLFPMLPYVNRYISTVLGFFGAYVASAHVFLSVIQDEIDYSVPLAICALFIIVAQVFFVSYLEKAHAPT